MTETQRLILSIVILVISIGIFIFFYVITKKKSSYRLSMLKEIEQKNKEYYFNIKLKDGKYFPYYKRVKSGFRYNGKSSGEHDEVTGLNLPKRYSFMDERIIYVINNELHYPINEIEIDGIPYFEITKKIKTIEILVSNDLPSHFMLKYEIKFTSDGKIEYKVEEEVNEDEHRRG